MTRAGGRNARKPARMPKKGAALRRARSPWRARLAAWRDQHFYGFFSSLGRLVTRPWATLLTVLVLACALALPLLFYLAFDNARDLSGGLREAREITAFLKPATDAKGAAAFAGELRRRADVADVLVRTPEQGLAEFRQLSGFGAALDVLKTNPLPSVLVVTPRGVANADNPALVTDLNADARVDLVQYDAAWRRKLETLLAFGERFVVVVSVLLAMATLLVIGNTVRMDIQTRAEEVSVMQLIGASNGFVRRPFLYSGLWYGLLGSVFALVIVVAVEWALAEPLARLFESYNHSFGLHGIGVLPACVVIAAGALLGWVGAYVVLGSHLVAGRPQT